MRKAVIKISLLAGLVAASNCTEPVNATVPVPFKGGTPPCDALIAVGLRDRILLPSDAAYEDQVNTWWSKNARLHPWCIVLPQSTKEVSQVLTTLVDLPGDGAGHWHIAVRSGGNGWQLNSNIQNGVTIDLTRMNSSVYDPETNVARVDTGGHWESVYADLDEQGVVVVGGRDGNVGVGGFLLGGGTSFFSPWKAFGCDNIVNHEVVLANGTIVNANKTSNADLWRALKGGGSNFGIVTRFDLEAMPTRKLHYELRTLPGNASEAVIDTLVAFSDYDTSMADNALVTYLSYNTSVAAETTIGTIYVNTAGDDNASTAYDSLREVPAVFNATTKQTLAQSAVDSKAESGTWASGATLVVKNNPSILRGVVRGHEAFVKTLQDSIGKDSFRTMIFLQPLPKDYARIAEEKGGNMLGLENMRFNAVMWTGGVFVTTNEADFAVAQQRLSEMAGAVHEYAESVDGAEDLVYLNYANTRQDVFASYGADNVKYLREVAAKYDPNGVFQTRIPGGFKISRIGV
ncbi:FAD binding domain-containing protein [Colletotrichum musicola]|uniref:FAD binding domain-containing protein n=1 Tax=Colletotrichum musicola TaxID=2175873 RepID=A0A8H6MYL1_9PEZI|nr:FAD binding domain-containing protein [Colletotrichum musicola]